MSSTAVLKVCSGVIQISLAEAISRKSGRYAV